jgi:hypothetical protein
MTNISRILAVDTNGLNVWITPEQLDALKVLETAQLGGFAAVHGYVPATGYVTKPVVDIQMLTRFSYTRLLNRKMDALKAIEFSDIPANVIPSDKLKGKTALEWFDIRKTQEIASMQKTLDNDRSDAHRQGHDRCYAHFAQGISAHLVTEKVDGLMQPVLTNGYATVKSIMVSYLQLNRKVVVEGIRKPVNSGASVLVKNAINALLNDRSVGIRKLSLKEDNFDSLTISKNVVIPANIQAVLD